jgi:uncharacterized membrane protein
MLKKSLWDFYDGEPFMENPHLAIVGANPRSSKQKGKTMAARRKVRRHRKNAPRRKARRTAKRNFPSAGLVFNPRGRKRRAKRNPHHKRRTSRRHSMRRNPALLGVTLPPIAMLAWGAGGFLAAPMLEGFVSKFVPAQITGNVLGRYAMKVASVLGLTWLTKTIMSNKEAFPVALGGSLYVIVSAVNEFVPQLTQLTPPQQAGIPSVNAYRSNMIKAYRGGMIATGVGAYTPGRMLNGSLPNLAGSLPQLAQPSTMMSPYNLAVSGMTNPVFADPRFTSNAQVPR